MAMLGILPPPFKPVWQQIRLLLQKVESSSTFLTKSEHVAHFTGPRQTRFAPINVTSVYGATPP